MRTLLVIAALVFACSPARSSGPPPLTVTPGTQGTPTTTPPPQSSPTPPVDVSNPPDLNSQQPDFDAPPPGLTIEDAGVADVLPPAQGALPALTQLSEASSSSTTQTGQWQPTNAAGCDGLVPAAPAPRIWWTSSNASSQCADFAVDAQGNLAQNFVDRANYEIEGVSFVPADGSDAAAIESSAVELGVVATHSQGFTMGAVRFSPQSGYWSVDVSKNGADLSATPTEGPSSYIVSNGRGTSVRWADSWTPNTMEGNDIVDWTYAQFVDASGSALTPWYALYGAWYVNVDQQLLIDRKGNLLVIFATSYPMSMPCVWGPTYAAWLSPDGTLKPFTPLTPQGAASYDGCQTKQFGGFGTPVPLPDGGFAFYLAPPGSPNFQYAPYGWYAAYDSMSIEPREVPQWLQQLTPPIAALPSGAYLSLNQDPASCARTAVLDGPQGQTCAKLPLEGSDGCSSVPRLTADGTLALVPNQPTCAITYWPRLAR